MPCILKIFVRIALLSWVSVVMATPCFAGYVTMETRMGTQVAGQRLEVIARIANLGNAPAIEVSAVLEALGKSHSGQVVSPGKVAFMAQKGGVESLLEYGDVRLRESGDSLGTGEAVVLKYVLDLPKDIQGSYPAILRIVYKDENSLAFSSLAGIVFKTVGAPHPGLKAEVKEKKHGAIPVLAVNLSNSTDKVLQVRGRLALPESLACQDSDQSLTILPGGHALLEFEVENLINREGSHAIFCLLEYQDREYHYTVLAGTSLQVAPRPHWFTRTRPWWVGLDIVLACLFAGAWLTVWRRQAG